MKQTLTDNKFGNCLQTCLAVILNKDINYVPNFMLFEHNWWNSFVMYLGTHGYSPEFIDNEPPPCDGKEYIVSLKFKIHSSGIAHAVIMKDEKVCFDPWPNVDYDYEDSIICGYYLFQKVK